MKKIFLLDAYLFKLHIHFTVLSILKYVSAVAAADDGQFSRFLSLFQNILWNALCFFWNLHYVNVFINRPTFWTFFAVIFGFHIITPNFLRINLDSMSVYELIYKYCCSCIYERIWLLELQNVLFKNLYKTF